MNKKKKHIRIEMICGLMVFFMIMNLSGCSLAADKGGGAQLKDTLIGVAVTREKFEKTYAQVIWEENTIKELDFPEIEEIHYVYTTWENADGTLVYSTVGTKAVDGHACYSTIDEKGSIELTVNAYVVPKEKEEYCVVYMNPVYMTSEKEIYTVSGRELSVKKEDGAEGASTGTSFNETERLKWIDSEIEVTVSVRADLYVADQPLVITLSEMSDRHQVIKKTKYEPGTVPEFIYAEEETAYILVETELEGFLGQNTKDFEVCSWDGITTYQDEESEGNKEQNATLMDTFSSLSNGIRLKNSTWVIWPE